MRNKVLYFPYINVPNSIWFTRMLLYWDQVGAIIPYEFIEDPDRLDNYTRSLVQANLVTQVLPGDHLYKIPLFNKSFITYLESLGSELDNRRKSFNEPSGFHNFARIHIEKVDTLGGIFVDMGIAKKHNYEWYDVEVKTGNEFMAYLAAALGNIENLHSMPITDELKYLENFIYSNSSDLKPEEQISSLRLQILEDLFPAPNKSLSANEIEMFKLKHGNILSEFRRKVESEIINIANINNEDLRQRQLGIFKSEAYESIEEIKSKLKESGYNRLTIGKLGSVVAAIPGASTVMNLANAVYNAFEKSDSVNINRSFLYAAYAQKEILE